MTGKCRHVMRGKDGRVNECHGQFYSDGKHWHDFPRLSPPREPRRGDIDHQTGQPVPIPEAS